VVGQLPSGFESRLGAIDPTTLLLIAATLVVALVLGWWARRRLRTPGTTLRRRLARRDSVTVLMHPNPDPDAMACALGVAYLADSVDTEATIQYPGQVRHPENRAFRTSLFPDDEDDAVPDGPDIELGKIERADDLASETVVLVDHNDPRGFDGAERIEPYAVVDHHPGGGTGSSFTDVREDYGACASIVTEYFETLDAECVGPDETPDGDGVVLSANVATGLLYGILSDTQHLTKGCTDAEFAASKYLYPTVDEDDLYDIANPPVDAEMLDVKATAITKRVVRPPFAISDVGTVSNVDAIPQAADELLTLEGVLVVVVLGDRDGVIHLSGRSKDSRVHVGQMLETVTDDIPMASGGGHTQMAGGQISIEHMEGIGPSNGLERGELHDKLFDAMAGEE
jgi:nanoRNase/pAp phosphatase (c-di-AMP/oligoRNAs hydrolase)